MAELTWRPHFGQQTVLGTLLNVAVLIFIYNPAEGASCGLSFQHFSECRLLNPSVALHWRDEGDAVTLAMEVDGTWDWLGFGVSEAGGMKGTDMAIVRRNLTENARWTIGDYWSMAFRMPRLDEGSQDVLLLLAGWSNGTTAAVLRRPLDTCNEQEDIKILRGTMQYFVYAYGTGWGYHGKDNRGNVQLVLLPLQAGGNPVPAPPPAVPEPPNSSSTWEVRMSNIVIPAQDTSYLCRNFEVPNPETKVHITRWKIALDNPRQVHHMIIYACSQKPAQARDVYECMAMDPACVAFYTIWAPGSDYMDMPEEAGLALGGNIGVRWLALQVHYTNTDLQEGVVDSSGFLLTISTNLRQHDMGILALGTLEMVIPAGNPNFTSKPNLCPSACTQRLQHPVTMVQAGFHMHTLGRAAQTRWFRNGKELPLLNERRAYDFNYQGHGNVDVSRNVLLPGDELLTTCSWDSTSRNTTTYWGESTSDEMCFHFISYYPRVPGVDICSSTRSSLLGPQSVAFCTTVGRVRELSDVLGSRNFSAMFNMYVAMTTAGELVPAPTSNYTAYTPTCTPYNFTSGSGGGDDGRSQPGDGGDHPLPPSPLPAAAKPPSPSPQKHKPPPPRRRPPPPRRRDPPPRKVNKPPPPSHNSPKRSPPKSTKPPPPMSGVKRRPPPPRLKSPPPRQRSPPPRQRSPPPRQRSPPPKVVRKPPPPGRQRRPPPHRRQPSPAQKGQSTKGNR